jgi:hypothetical protein
MNKKKRLLLTCTFAFFAQAFLFGQDKLSVKFGKITPADFNLSTQKYDSGAEAVVIADVGSSAFIGNNKGWFSLEFRHTKRIKILSKTGFEAATVTIPLFFDGDDIEKLQNLKAVTYNMENGHVVETKLDDKSLFTEKLNKNLVLKKFTFPAVKEGSIIEYSYLQTSDFLRNLQPWEFQSEYPCLWSEYKVDIPDFFNYVFLSQGHVPFSVDTASATHDYFRLMIPGGAERNEMVNLSASVVSHLWIMKNIPALKEEKFTTTLRNHISKIEFQLSQYRFPDEPIKNVMTSWFSVSESLMDDEDFGADLGKPNSWLTEDLKAITKGASTPREKAEKIYDWVRDNCTCTDHDARFLSNPIKTIFKNKSGNVADLNLLLDAMLKHENIEVDPVLLSTRDHGFTHSIYPLMNRYNYVICRAIIDSVAYLLDASQPWLGFAHLPGYCYNGQARVINKSMPIIVNLNAGDISESKTTMVFIANDGKGGLSGSYQSVPGYFESSSIRQKVRDKGEKDYFSTVQSAYSGGIQIANTEIDSVKLPTNPVKVSYDFSVPHDTTEDIVYFNPILATETYKENPFKAATRTYPVEIPYAMDETYILNMDVPAGYKIEELPKSTKVLFNTDEGYFEYIVQKDENNIQLRSRVKLLKADFKPDDYAVLRDFFAFVVKKQSEQFVFKKKK